MNSSARTENWRNQPLVDSGKKFLKKHGQWRMQYTPSPWNANFLAHNVAQWARTSAPLAILLLVLSLLSEFI